MLSCEDHGISNITSVVVNNKFIYIDTYYFGMLF